MSGCGSGSVGISRNSPFDARVIDGASRALETLTGTKVSGDSTSTNMYNSSSSNSTSAINGNVVSSVIGGGYFSPSNKETNRKRPVKFILSSYRSIARPKYSNMSCDNSSSRGSSSGSNTPAINNSTTTSHFPGANKALDKLSLFQSSVVPDISIHSYLERIALYSKCSEACFVIALVYIDRLIEAQEISVTLYNVHRLFITAILLATKLYDDEYYNNSYYAKLGGIQIKEMNLLESEFALMIGYSLHVDLEIFEIYASGLFPKEVFKLKSTTASEGNNGSILSTSSTNTTSSTYYYDASSASGSRSTSTSSTDSLRSCTSISSTYTSIPNTPTTYTNRTTNSTSTSSSTTNTSTNTTDTDICPDVDYDALMRQFMSVYSSLNALAVDTCTYSTSTSNSTISSTINSASTSGSNTIASSPNTTSSNTTTYAGVATSISHHLPSGMIPTHATRSTSTGTTTHSAINSTNATSTTTTNPADWLPFNYHKPTYSTSSANSTSNATTTSNTNSTSTSTSSNIKDDLETFEYFDENDFVLGSIRSNHKPQLRKHYKLRRFEKPVNSSNSSYSVSDSSGGLNNMGHYSGIVNSTYTTSTLRPPAINTTSNSGINSTIYTHTISSTTTSNSTIDTVDASPPWLEHNEVSAAAAVGRDVGYSNSSISRYNISAINSTSTGASDRKRSVGNANSTSTSSTSAVSIDSPTHVTSKLSPQGERDKNHKKSSLIMNKKVITTREPLV